ncbi:hypothetical protein F5B19DRAFT_484697 [Rostrohypoxylon terebratum]|nr:hypothetical protein F5B19DRAFT_484697 [Rostrohypoxylon terebratum]
MSTTYILGSINQSHRSDYDVVPEGPIARLSTPVPSMADVIYPHLTWSTLWFTLLCVFVATNMKNLPLMWHMRLLNAFRFVLRTQRPTVPLTPAHIFQPIITSSTAQLMEIDFNIHKSNSSYFSDADIARAHLVCTLFAKGVEHMRGGTAAYTGSGKPLFGLALGAVSCNFKREIRPQEQYEMWSKILTWDEKWVYIVTHFVRKGAVKPKSYSLYPEQFLDQRLDEKSSSKAESAGVISDKVIFATALSKCVFKAGRKTVSPETMFQVSGLLPSAGNADSKGFDEATLRKIEEQRLKGLVTAQSLRAETQQNLEDEFDPVGCEALGKHTDGAGIVGVVNTLMQLAHLKKSQVL